jgi:hypothetical protein
MPARYPFFGGLAFATLATLGGVMASRAESAPGARGLMFAYAPDSTPLFGPKQLNAPASGFTIYAERFLAVSGSSYALKVENGAPGGIGRVGSGTIRLNTTVILSPGDVAGTPTLLARFVMLISRDALKVELSAGSGQFVTACVLASLNPRYPPYPRYPVRGPTLTEGQVRAAGATATILIILRYLIPLIITL